MHSLGVYVGRDGMNELVFQKLIDKSSTWRVIRAKASLLNLSIIVVTEANERHSD